MMTTKEHVGEIEVDTKDGEGKQFIMRPALKR
jgi:hypothetical protein